MDAVLDSTPSPPAKKPAVSRPRIDVARCLDQRDQLDAPGISESQSARCLGVPDSTLRTWLQQRQQVRQSSSWPRSVVDFFESAPGQCCLHRVLTAAHLVFVQANDAGIRGLCEFLELSWLDEFIAASYGAQQQVAEVMETRLLEFAQEEERRLAAHMPSREITLCEDETFHQRQSPCLVAIEPVSNFILVEQYEPRRDAATWNRVLDERLAGTPVTVCQVTSDLAQALVAHAEGHLGAHHSPDLFHVQHDTVKATGAALAGQTRRVEEHLAEVQAQVTATRQELEACQRQCPENSHGLALQRQLAQTQAAQAATEQLAKDCQQRQKRARDARQGLGNDYHPIDLATGQSLSAEEVEKRLVGHFDALDQVAREAGLSLRAREKLAKARRVLPLMLATITFFWKTIATRLKSLNSGSPPEAVRSWLCEQLIPAYYLRRAAEKADTAAERRTLRETAERLFARARSPDGIYATLGAEEQADLERQAADCADLFQRSSSCVEGRNGQLSLTHHGLHRLSPRKLRALTVLHNYLVRRADDTTAAERFYGTRPRELFPWLLDHLSHPTRPRARRRAA